MFDGGIFTFHVDYLIQHNSSFVVSKTESKERADNVSCRK